jgi:hypothetical protein
MNHHEGIPLYHRVLRAEFLSLSELLRQFHSQTEFAEAEGCLDVEAAGGRLGSMLAWLGGLPRPETQVPVRLKVTVSPGQECWERWFRGHRLVSWQKEWRGMLLETVGPWTIGFALMQECGGMRFLHVRTWLLGISWPKKLSPVTDALVLPTDDGWNVDVQITLPLAGQLIRYRGIMKPR